MVKKIGYDNKIWNTLEKERVIDLIEKFRVTPIVESDVFEELVDYIWDSGTCKPLFFAVIPHIIEIASVNDFETAKDLWCYLGNWIATHEKYREGISDEVLECFDLALECAEERCINQIVSADQMSNIDAQYLYASLFAFAKHRLGYMTMSGYKDGIAGTSIAVCQSGHLNDVTIYNSGIVPYEMAECPHNVREVYIKDIKIEDREDNPWILLGKKIQKGLAIQSTSKEIVSHLKLAQEIIRHGVTPNLSMKYAFSLYGSLLYCNGSFSESMRILHGWDEFTCLQCGEKFIFADGWCEDMDGIDCAYVKYSGEKG